MILVGRFGIRRQRLNSNARIASTAPFACGAVLSWAESTQRPPLSWKKAPKEPKSICCGFTSFGISFPSLLRIQHGRSSSLTPPRVRLRSSNSLLYSACAVLSKNPAGGNQAVIVKLQHKQNPAGEAPTGIFHLQLYFLSGFSLIRHPLALGAVSPGDAYIV